MAHSFIELDKADWLVFCDCGFQSVCPLMENDKRLLNASWWERLTEQPTLVMYLHSSARSGEVGNLMNAFLFCPKQVTSGFKPCYPSQTKKKKKKRQLLSNYPSLEGHSVSIFFWLVLFGELTLPYFLVKEVCLTSLSGESDGYGFSFFFPVMF